jgi:hypothetical protein
MFLMGVYSSVQSTCYKKCINKKFYEAELSTGEAVCLDRCVSKFFATHQKMNEVYYPPFETLLTQVLMNISAQMQPGQ